MKHITVKLMIAVSGALSDDGDFEELRPVADAAIAGARAALIGWASENLEKDVEPLFFTPTCSLKRDRPSTADIVVPVAAPTPPEDVNADAPVPADEPAAADEPVGTTTTTAFDKLKAAMESAHNQSWSLGATEDTTNEQAVADEPVATDDATDEPAAVESTDDPVVEHTHEGD